MRYVVCSVYDLGVGAFSVPFFARSRGEAVRNFRDACRDPQLPFKRHAKDFTLVLLSEWEDENGSFEVPKNGGGSVISALECQALDENSEREIEMARVK